MAENILLYSTEKDFQEESPANGFCFIDTMEEEWGGETESSKQLDHSDKIYFTTDSRQEDFKLKTIELLRWFGFVLNVNETENSARYKAGELILLSGLSEYNSYVSHVITAYSSFTETFHDSETHTGIISGITFFLDGVSSGAVSAITYRSDTYADDFSETKWPNYIEVYDTDENFIGVLVKLPGKEDLIANNFIDGINTFFDGDKLIERKTGIAATPTDSGYLITHINFIDMSSCGFTVSDGEYFDVVREFDEETGTISRAFKKFYTEGETGSTHYSNTSLNQVINSIYEIFYEVGDETKSPYYFTTYWYNRNNSNNINYSEGRGSANGVYKGIQSDTYGTQLTSGLTDSFLYITESDFGKSKFVTKAIPGVSYVLESNRVAYNWSGEIDDYDIEIRISSSSDYEITTDLTCADFSVPADTATTYSILFIDENNGNETELEARYVGNDWYICYSGLRKDNVRVFTYNDGTFRFKCDGAGNIILRFTGPA